MSGYDRGVNLYQPKTLQANWFEDREQATVGTNDGLRTGTQTFAQLAESTEVRVPESDISMAKMNAWGRSVAIDPASRLKRLPRAATDRVIPNFGPNEDQYVTSHRIQTDGVSLQYMNSPPRKMLGGHNFSRESVKARATARAEFGCGSVVPRHNPNMEAVGTMESTHTRDFSVPADAPQEKAGFTYDAEQTSQVPMSFPAPQASVPTNPWGETKDEKQGRFDEHHIRSSAQAFPDMTGRGSMQTVFITNPSDGSAPPLPLPEGSVHRHHDPVVNPDYQKPTHYGRVVEIAQVESELYKRPGMNIFSG